MRRQLFSLWSLLALGASTLCGQSNFQDLNFESVTVVPVPDPYGRVSLSAAMPGWLGFSGTTPLDRVNYNSQFLDSTGIAILNANTFWGGPIQGYTALLQAGADLCCADLNIRADVGLAQTGTIPADSHSIQFAGRMGFTDLNSRFTASFGGQPLALVQTGTMADYGLYGADVSAFAGQTGELRFMVSAGTSGTGMRNIFLDSIQFSPMPVPEPGALAVLAPGAAVFLLWRSRRRRES
jgi:hypothetical protein